jgi:hypothetical protein
MLLECLNKWPILTLQADWIAPHAYSHESPNYNVTMAYVVCYSRGILMLGDKRVFHFVSAAKNAVAFLKCLSASSAAKHTSIDTKISGCLYSGISLVNNQTDCI